MFSTILLLFLSGVASLPLQQDSLITLRTTESQPSAGGNRVLYKQLILEEWSSSYEPLQNWSLPCSLPDLASTTLTEGLLRSSYPFGDGIWFLCRDVPVGSNLSYTPAPTLIMNLQENGFLQQWASDTTSYPAGTSANLVYTWYDSALGNQVFYTLGGFSPIGSTGPQRPAQPRIRMDTGPGTPPDLQGALANIATNVNPTGMSIMTNTLFIPALLPNGTSTPIFSIFQVGTDNQLPTTVRSIVSYAIYNEPVMLSVWTFPYIDVIWYTGFNRVPYVARTNFSVTDPAQMTLVLPLPPSSSGSLGVASWRVGSARFEGNYFSTGETIYLQNGTHIYKNTVVGLAQGLPYESVIRAPQGWKYLDIHTRVVLLPTPSATPTASATATSSSSATSSPTSTSSASVTSSLSSTSSSSPSASPSAKVSVSSSSSPSPSSSASASVSQSQNPTFTPSSTPSNGTIPIPANNIPGEPTGMTAGEVTGISLGSIAAICVAGLLLLNYSPALKNLYTRQFGSSVKAPKKGLSFRSPVTTDMPITISHNPHALVQYRLEQLKDLQKQISMRETSIPKQNPDVERTKKQFGPVIAGESV